MANLQVEVKVMDIEPMKEMIELFKRVIVDERIDNEVRQEYQDEINFILNKTEEDNNE